MVTKVQMKSIHNINGKISRKMRHINIVFHTAAFKHVILCERAPFEAAQTNIQGVQNILMLI